MPRFYFFLIISRIINFQKMAASYTFHASTDVLTMELLIFSDKKPNLDIY